MHFLCAWSKHTVEVWLCGFIVDVLSGLSSVFVKTILISIYL